MARQNPDKFISEFFKIRLKEPGAPLALLKFNHPQQVSRRLRREERKQGLPIRHFYLKSRQVGQSTDTAADVAAHTWANDNYQSLIIAHDKTRASSLLEMAHIFFNNLPLPLQLLLARSTSERISFEGTNSGTTIMTAANFTAGRGATIHEVQASEFCFYEDPALVMQAIEQLLPMMPGTQGVIETTAYMAGSPAHQFWQESLENTIRLAQGKNTFGNNPYRGYFHAWQDDPKNAKPFKNDFEQAEILAQMFFEFPDLIGRMEQFKLTPEQMYFYFETLKLKCQGDEVFMSQEYPCEEGEAWSVSGKPIFPTKQLGAYMTRTRPGILYNVWRKDREDLEEITLFNKLEDLKEEPLLDRKSMPYIEIWKPPQPGRKYLIGADGSAGYQDSDFSSAFIHDMVTLEQVGEVHGRFEPDKFALLLRSLGVIYNNAIIAPEVDGVGLTVLSHLKDKYWNIYYRREETAKGIKVTNKMGWSTNIGSRPQLIINAKRIFLERYRTGGERMSELIRSKSLVDELRTYITGPTGKPEAANGCHDDRVMAWFITLIAIFHELYNTIAKEDGNLPGPILSSGFEAINPRMDDVLEAILDPPRGWAQDDIFLREY